MRPGPGMRRKPSKPPRRDCFSSAARLDLFLAGAGSCLAWRLSRGSRRRLRRRSSVTNAITISINRILEADLGMTAGNGHDDSVEAAREAGLRYVSDEMPGIRPRRS